MSWTEESIIAEFKVHIAYWQYKLRLRDVTFTVAVRDWISDDSNSWCSVRSAYCESNPHEADIWIKRGSYVEQTRYDVWSTVAHELVHVMNWSMSRAFDPLTDHFAASQLNMAKVFMKRGNEELAYKWEAILIKWFEADAPPKEIPQ